MYEERLQPHNIEAEEAVIGSLLIDGEAIVRVAARLRPEDFYRDRNAYCYEACLALFERREAINQVTVTNQLRHQERLEPVGGAAYLSHLIASVPTSLHILHYAEIVGRCSTMRRLIGAAAEIASIGYQGSTDEEEALSQAENLLFSLRGGRSSREFIPLRNVLDQFLEQRAEMDAASETPTSVITTGFDSLEQLLGGLQPSDLIILAARPSVGKSTLAVNMAVSAAQAGSTVGVFSLEMSRDQLAMRILASEAEVDSHRLRLWQQHGLDLSPTEEQRIIEAVGSLSDLSLYIDDTPLQGIMEMRSKARRLHLERSVDLLMVDYMQLIEGQRRLGNRVQEISEISRSLKGLARDLNIPVVAVSQLSRAVEMRPSHRPQLSDLRESGSIEQDADVVMFIFREDMYTSEDEWLTLHPDGPEYPRNVAEIIVAKHRHGPIGSVKLLFQNHLVKFAPAAMATEMAQP